MRARWMTIAMALAGCTASAGGFDAGAPVRPRDGGRADAAPLDAAPPVLDDGGACEGVLELGRCQLAGGGACTGEPDELAIFVAMAEGDSIPVVVGPQASSMLVLAARTRGIAPGDPTQPASRENPVVEIEILDGAGAELATYRGRAAFSPDALDPTLLVQPRLFVVVEGALDRLEGPAVARATLRDVGGEIRCGVLAFSPTR